jgi:hypothetical protein
MKFQTNRKRAQQQTPGGEEKKKNTNYKEARKTKCCVKFTIGTIYMEAEEI